MKKLIPLLIVFCLMLTACGNDPTPTTEPTEGPTTAAPTTTAPTEAPTTAPSEPATQPTTEATEPPALYRHPLNGTPLYTPYNGRPVAVVINNHGAAQPQHSVSDADIFYEIMVEGGITRCLAVFSDLSEVGEIGSIRSARTYFISLARSYSGILVHSGTSVHANNAFPTSGVPHLDGPEPYFYRKQSRLDAGIALEHTMFTTGPQLLACLQERGLMTELAEGTDFGLRFDDNATISGAPATKATIVYSVGRKTNELNYDQALGMYRLTQFDKEYIDGNTEDAVPFSNVLVLYAKHRTVETGHVFHTLTGENKGYLLMNGQMVPILWHRENEQSPFTYTLEDGTPVNLKPGRTYISIVPTGSTVTAE